jgi:hypothetical protein
MGSSQGFNSTLVMHCIDTAIQYSNMSAPVVAGRKCGVWGVENTL